MKTNIDYSSNFRILKGGKVSLVIAALLVGNISLLNAAPTGGVVTTGSAFISTNKTTTNITQSTNKASINWKSFSIAPNESVNFIQPNSSSITLNRVIGVTNSLIQGTMNANGQVFLINPNGIIFSKGSSVNVGGLVASTLNISDADFQAGNYSFKGDSTQSILNMGKITINSAGYAVLAGKSVSNEGFISATLGNVQLAGASKISIDLNGNSLVKLTIDKGILDALVKNKGIIQAKGGKVYLTTKAVNSILNGMVNNTGVIEANSIEKKNGEIVLFAHGGTLQAGGTLTTGKGTGNIETSGKVFTSNSSLHVTTGNWLLDPYDITVDTILANSIDSALGSGDVTISTNGNNNPNTSSGETWVTDNGDINVNAPMSWNANTLTLSAGDNIYINAQLDLTSTAGLSLQYAQANGSTGHYYIHAPVNIATTGSFSTKNGSEATINYTIIDSLGNAGSTTGTDLQGMSGNLSGHYALGANIDASATSSWNSNAGFAPIGGEESFTGIFDGLGHTIKNLYINRRTTVDDIGLFSVNYSLIRNIGLIGGSVIGHDETGGLVGENYGTISNCYTTGSVIACEYSGGLVGENDGIIKNSYATGSVSSYAKIGGEIGGLVGWNTKYISNSYATGSVSGTGSAIGGLVGYNDNFIENSYWDKDTTGQSTGVGTNYDGTVNNLTGVDSSTAFKQSTYVGFDFKNTWYIHEGHSYPLLIGITPPLVTTFIPPEVIAKDTILANITLKPADIAPVASIKGRYAHLISIAGIYVNPADFGFSNKLPITIIGSGVLLPKGIAPYNKNTNRKGK